MSGNVTKELIERAILGEQEATAELLTVYWPRLYRAAWGALRNSAAAEDAAQDAAIEIYRCIGNLNQPNSFVPWSFKILKRSVLKMIPRDEQQCSVEVQNRTLGDFSPGIDEKVDLLNAIRVLTPSHRLAILYTYYGDLKGDEAADALGVPAGTLRYHLTLARRKLRLFLHEYTNDAKFHESDKKMGF